MPFLSSKSWFIIWIKLFTGFEAAEDKMNQFPNNRINDDFSISPFFFLQVIKKDGN